MTKPQTRTGKPILDALLNASESLDVRNTDATEPNTRGDMRTESEEAEFQQILHSHQGDGTWRRYQELASKPAPTVTPPGKHTPGPWEVGNGQHYDGTAILANDGDDLIAECVLLRDRNIEQVQANARLIAAAPDLLAACKAVIDAQGWVTIAHATQRYDDAISAVSAAIAKAEGNQ